MKSVYRAENAELNMSYRLFVVFTSPKMTANIVAPPKISYIACGKSKIRQVRKGKVGNEGVARKTERITMRAYARVSRKNEGREVVGRVVQIMIVVERPQRIEPFYFGLCSLLPIYPPKIYAVLFERFMQDVEIGGYKARIGNVEFYLFSVNRIHSHRFRHFRVSVCPKSHSVRRVDIQRYFKPQRFKIF